VGRAWPSPARSTPTSRRRNQPGPRRRRSRQFPLRLNDVRVRSRAVARPRLVFPVPVGLVSESVSLPGAGLGRRHFRPDTIQARRVCQERSFRGASGRRASVTWRWQTLVVAVERPRRVEVRPFPSNRRLVTAAMRAGRSKMPMYGLVDVDITTANRLLAGHDPPWSLTAFVVASVARAAAAHPGVHAYRNWRGQLVTHRHVDVGTMVEIATPQGPFAIPHLLRDADIREVPDLTAELRRVKRDPSASSSGRWLERAGPAATRIPGVIPAMYAVMARSVAARQRIGTVAVTAVGMFAGGGGFGITSLSLMSLEVIVGGMSQRPRVTDGRVTVRDVLDLTVAIDHNVVDGAPAARFAAEFRELLESAAVISPSSVALQAPG
jgi:pyruvate/2-oxoglutarate dehydrogenase complex dihydrolipoamide acyltransferase (E2) component